MKKLLALGLLVIAASGCTPADQQYCNNFGVAGTAEYGNCLRYYHQQEQAFGADRAFCDSEADGTYPRTLYDTGHYQPVFVHGGFSPHGRYYGGGISHVYVEPDYRRNAQVDSLRMRIVEPCMQARGWRSGETWQAGRMSVKKPRKATTTPKGSSLNQLPWLH